uniref:MSHA biogenesis protein MshO n=1 Tax=Syphacia muris TaxID=451379 RepID=A0A0N5A8B4_9BILA
MFPLNLLEHTPFSVIRDNAIFFGLRYSTTDDKQWQASKVAELSEVTHQSPVVSVTKNSATQEYENRTAQNNLIDNVDDKFISSNAFYINSSYASTTAQKLLNLRFYSADSRGYCSENLTESLTFGINKTITCILPENRLTVCSKNFTAQILINQIRDSKICDESNISCNFSLNNSSQPSTKGQLTLEIKTVFDSSRFLYASVR